MIEHLVLMKVRPDAEPQAIRHFLDAFRAMPNQIPGLIEVTNGANFSTKSKGYTHGMLMRYGDRKAFEAYKAHPALLQTLELWDKIKGAVQLEVDYEVNGNATSANGSIVSTEVATASPPAQAVRHLTLLQLKEGVSTTAKEILDSAQALKCQIPNVIDLTAGSTFSTWSQNYTHGLQACFPNRTDYEAYLAHPAHQHLLKITMPILVDIVDLDYEF